MAVDKVIIQYEADIAKLRKDLDEIKKANGQVQDTAKEADKELDKMNTTGSKLSGIFEQIGRAAIAAFAVERLLNFGKEVVQLGMKMEGLNTQLKFITGSSSGAADSMDFLRRTANKYGVELISLTEAYTKFLGAATKSGISIEKSRRIFENVTIAARAMNLSVEDTNGVFLALQQIVSKGTVQAEELRGQLGERLPGAFSIAAKAIGVTERELNKMLEQGQVISSEFLPAFTEQLRLTFEDGMTAAANSTAANTARIKNEFTELKIVLAEQLTPAWNTFAQTFLTFMNSGAFTNIAGMTANIAKENREYKNSMEGIIDAFEDSGMSLDEYNQKAVDYIINTEAAGLEAKAFAQRFDQQYIAYRRQIDVLSAYATATGGAVPPVKDLDTKTKLLNETMSIFAETHGEGKPAGVDYMLQQLLKSYQELSREVTDILPDLSKQEDIFNEIGFSGLALNPVVLNLTAAYKEGRITLDQYIDSVKELKEAQGEGGDTTNDYLDDMIKGFGAANELFGVYSMLLTDTANKQSALADFGRQLAFFEIATAQAVAIANAVKTVSGSSLNAIDYFIALTSILSSIGVTIGRAKGLIEGANAPKFAKGVVDLQGEGTETSDSIWARLSKGESVITAKGTKQDKGLFKAANKMQLQEYINQNYVLPMILRKEGEKQSAFDDYRLYLAMMNNQKAVRDGSRQVVDAIKRRSRRYDWN